MQWYQCMLIAWFRKTHTYTYTRLPCGTADRILQSSGESTLLASIRELISSCENLEHVLITLEKYALSLH